MRRRYIAKVEAARGKARRQLDPWYGAHTLNLEVPGGRTFACHVVPHLAIELAELDCRVRVANKRGWLELQDGKAVRGAEFFLSMSPLRAGNVVPVQAKGPEAHKSLLVVKSVFEESKTERRERMERHPELPEWWHYQEVPMTLTTALNALASPKRIMGWGGIQ